MTTLPTAGSTIGQYELVQQIGTGGMATVFKARQPKLERNVAIKIMHQIFLSDNNFLARFEREARIVARLDHANIVPVYDYDDLNGVPYLVMKYIDGQTLKDVLAKGPLTLDRILEVITAVASALTFAHSQGVLHRDVKPSNILIDERGMPYLTDFGLARIAQAGESTMSADMMLGTPHYISPEQAQGSSNVDSRADVYSLGVVLYELVVGRAPFSGDTPYIIVHKHIYDMPPHPSDMNEDIPLAVANVILKALSKAPDDRYATPNDLADAFRKAVAESGLSHLSEDRASVSQKAMAQLPSQPPVRKPKEAADGQAHKQAMEAVIAQVSTSFKSDKEVAIPSPLPHEQTPPPLPTLNTLLSQETLSEVGVRFREAIADIRDQLSNGEIFQTMKSGAKDAFVEIQSHVEARGGKLDLNFGESSPIIQEARNLQKARNKRVIQREWSMEDDSIRRRAGERINRQRGLLMHIIMYGFFAFIVLPPIFGRADLLPAVVNDAELTPLFSVKWIAVIQLMWGSGVISHALEVFSKTGRRWDNRRRAVQTAMARRYGENWMDVATDSEYKKVRNRVEKRVDNRIGFLQHLVSAVMLTFSFAIMWGTGLQQFLINILADEPELVQLLSTNNAPSGFALLMGLTVLIHAIVVLVQSIFNSETKEEAIRREIEREREMMSVAVKVKNEDRTPANVRLTEDGELTESFVEDLNAPKVKRNI